MTDTTKQRLISYYDQEARQYDELYEKPLLEQEFYPANAIRLRIILDILADRGCRALLDVGCGSGLPLVRFLREGFDARGVDFSPGMVEAARMALSRHDWEPDRVMLGDLEQRDTLPDATFDAIVATGVFPHNLDDSAAYANLRHLLAPGGVALVEYRNALMSLFSVNKYSEPFFWHELIRGDSLPRPLRDATRRFVADKFDTDVENVGRPRDIEYTDILARFHNPLTLPEELARHGLSLAGMTYYHYHAAPPHLEKPHKKEFWEASLKLEQTQDWRGMFLCSAFVAVIER